MNSDEIAQYLKASMPPGLLIIDPRELPIMFIIRNGLYPALYEALAISSKNPGADQYQIADHFRDKVSAIDAALNLLSPDDFLAISAPGVVGDEVGTRSPMLQLARMILMA